MKNSIERFLMKLKCNLVSETGNFRKNEKGAIAVMVALGLTVLFGFSAMTVDFGVLASKKADMQSAVDAAALAAAAEVGAGRYYNVNATVNQYLSANDFDTSDSDIIPEFNINGRKVTVKLTQNVKMGFSAVLTGQDKRAVRVSATAEAVSMFGGCPYALFAGQRIEDSGSGITISGNDIHISGNIHSNSDISMPHATLENGAVATAVRNTSPSGTGWNSNSIALDMPSFGRFESAVDSTHHVVNFSGSVTKNSQTGFQELINEAVMKYRMQTGGLGYLGAGLFIHIPGDLTFHGNGSTAFHADFPITLIVDGDINLNGATINSSPDFPMAIMSKHGNVTVNGGGAAFTGIVYAPEGNVTLNGNNADYEGIICARNIIKHGGKINVKYNDSVDRFLPKIKVHLID